MAITFTKYIDITSGVGAGAVVARRELIGRLFTDNNLVPPQTFIDFTTIDDVGSYFGTNSEEYKRASFYFGRVSKNITKANKITFARWVSTAVAPRIYGAKLATTLSALQLITNGAFSLTLGTTNVVSGLDFSAATSLADVAAIIQTAIRTKTGMQWTAATVTYDVTRGSFNLVGGSAVADALSVQAPGTGTDISSVIGWFPESPTGAIWANGSLVETITNVLANSAEASNNFGSFLFMPQTPLTLDQVIEACAWNTTQNVLYEIMIRVNASNAVSYSAALLNYAGVAMTLAPLATEYPEQCPMMIMAATNYDAPNSVQNYMFQQFNLTPSVLTTVDSNTYDALRINYYGRTQTAGQLIDFYQRGVLTGLAVNPVDMNVYANEAWLKDAIGAIIMQLLLALAKVSANTQGRAQLLIIIQSVIDQALSNGTISVGKQLSPTQILFITEATNDDKAWYQVQTIGYWVDCQIQSFTTTDNRTEFKGVYTLVYSKDDVIRKVEGQDILI